MKKSLLNILIVLLINGCVNISQHGVRACNNYLSMKYNANDNNISIPIGFKNLKLIAPLIRVIDSNNYFSDTISKKLCDCWQLNNDDIKNIIKSMKLVTANEKFALCYELPCRYKGIVSDGLIKYNFSISPTSYIELSNEKSVLHFIRSKQSKFFKMPCDCCE